MTKPLESQRFVRIVTIIMALGAVLRFELLTRSVGTIDRVFVLDDTYYTMTIARSIADGHGPSASSGTLTSGFQPLIGFFFVPFFRFIHNPAAQLRIVLSITLLSDVLLIGAIALLVRRIWGTRSGIVAAGLWALSPTAIRYAATGLETSLALLLSVALVSGWLWSAKDETRGWRSVLVGGLCGLTVLARIDGIALVAILLFVDVLVRPRRALIAAMSFLATVAPWWLWCTDHFGTPIPQSGLHLLDRGWSGTSIHQMMAISGANIFAGPFATASPLQGEWYQHRTIWPFVVVVIAATVLIAKWLSESWREMRILSGGNVEVLANAARWVLVLFALSVTFFYTWFPVRWFTYRYVAPAVLVCTMLIAHGFTEVWQKLRQRRSTNGALFAWFSAVLLFLVVAPQLVRLVRLTTPISAGLGGRPSATAYFDSDTGWASNAVSVSKILPQGAVVSAQQSGALGWFGPEYGHRVVNLDGVVNPNVSGAHDVAGICNEINRRHVAYFADFSSLGIWLGRVCRPYGIFVEPSPRQISHPDRDLRIQRIRR